MEPFNERLAYISLNRTTLGLIFYDFCYQDGCQKEA
jgi:hypothetical protein